MKLAMAQMRMTSSTAENLEKSIRYMERAKDAGRIPDLFFNAEIAGVLGFQ